MSFSLMRYFLFHRGSLTSVSYSADASETSVRLPWAARLTPVERLANVHSLHRRKALLAKSDGKGIVRQMSANKGRLYHHTFVPLHPKQDQ